jgi:glycosyltransferase involved in cell wall biosynthesis
VYVIPSLQDNQPNTVLESMACATPVVGFDAGGISEMVRPGVTGELAPVADVTGLRDLLRAVLGDRPKLAAMAAACRSVVLKEFRLETQVGLYVELYAQALAASRRPARTIAHVSVGHRAVQET